MPSENAAHDIFVNLDAERMSHLLGNARTAEARIAVLHFEDRRDERALWDLAVPELGA